MITRVTATEAARKFSDILNRVRYRGEEIVIERGGEPVAKIVPVGPTAFTLSQLIRLLASLPKPDAGFRKIVREIARKQPPLPDSRWD